MPPLHKRNCGFGIYIMPFVRYRDVCIEVAAVNATAAADLAEAAVHYYRQQEMYAASTTNALYVFTGFTTSSTNFRINFSAITGTPTTTYLEIPISSMDVLNCEDIRTGVSGGSTLPEIPITLIGEYFGMSFAFWAVCWIVSALRRAVH